MKNERDRYLTMGLNALGRAASMDYFQDGHRGGAIVSGTYLCEEEPVEPEAAELIRKAIDREWGNTELCADFPEETARPASVDRIVEAMAAHSGGMRQAGHNVILPTLALKALSDVPGAATPSRIDGICDLVSRFTVYDGPLDDEPVDAPDPFEGSAFAAFALDEFTACAKRFAGRGQGWSGHLLTYSRAMMDLAELGYRDLLATLRDGYVDYVRRIRLGPLETDRPLEEHGPMKATPLEAPYWKEKTGPWRLGHVLKYPYGYYGLMRHCLDDEVKERAREEADRVL